MAKTKGNPNGRTFRPANGVQLKMTFHSGGVTWLPKDGWSKLDKQQRQKLCEEVLAEANAWGLLPKDVMPGERHPEENIMAVWKKLSGGAQ